LPFADAIKVPGRVMLFDVRKYGWQTVKYERKMEGTLMIGILICLCFFMIH